METANHMLAPLAFFILVGFYGYASITDPWVSSSDREKGMVFLMVSLLGVFLVLLVTINWQFNAGLIGTVYD